MIKSNYLISKLIINCSKLEDTIASCIKNNKLVKEVLKNAKSCEKISQKYTLNHTEALRLTGTIHWLLGQAAQDGLLRYGKFLSKTRTSYQNKKAMKWWKKSIDTGKLLNARLELSRTYFEAGKHVLVSLRNNGNAAKRTIADMKKIIGLTPEECLEQAEKMFLEMELRWDLEELRKVRDIIEINL